MATPLPIYNQGQLFRWDKESCHRYKFSMVGDFDQLDFQMVRLEGVENQLTTERLVQNFTVYPDAPYSVSFPYNEETKVFGDGIYRVCATGQTLQGTVTDLPMTKYRYGIFAVSDDVFSQFIVDGVTVYNSASHGSADMTNPPLSYANLNLRVQLAGGQTLYIQAGTNTVASWLGIESYDRLMFVFPSTALSMTLVSSNGTQSTTPDCVHFVRDQELPGTGRTYITGFVVGGVNVLPRQNYLMPDDEYIFFADVQNYLDANGGGTVNPANANQFLIISNACWLDDVVNIELTVGDTEKVTECEYIVELCDAYVCYTKLLRELLCKPDPCCDECEDKKRRKEIMENLRLMDIYFMNGLIPLVNRDRLWFFGNMNADPMRTQQITEINNVYLAFSRLAALCGNGCKPKNDCGC